MRGFFLLISLLLMFCTCKTDQVNITIDRTDWKLEVVDSFATGTASILIPLNYSIPVFEEELFSVIKQSKEEYPPIMVVNKTNTTAKLTLEGIKDSVETEFPEFTITNLTEGDGFIWGICVVNIDGLDTKGYYSCFQNPSTLELYHLIILAKENEGIDNFESQKDTMFSIVTGLTFK